MRTWKSLIAFAAMEACLFYCSCATVYIQNAEVTRGLPSGGPTILPGKDVKGQLALSLIASHWPKRSFRANNGRHSKVDPLTGEFVVDTAPSINCGTRGCDTTNIHAVTGNTAEFEGRNVTWTIPPLGIEVGIRYYLNDYVYLMGDGIWEVTEKGGLHGFHLGAGGYFVGRSMVLQASGWAGVSAGWYSATELHLDPGFLSEPAEWHWAHSDENGLFPDVQVEVTLNTVRNILRLTPFWGIGASLCGYVRDTEGQGVYALFPRGHAGFAYITGSLQVAVRCDLTMIGPSPKPLFLGNPTQWVQPRIGLDIVFFPLMHS